MKSCDALIVGGGPAGLAAAARLRQGGVDVVLLEREAEAGGIPRHCGHGGYGLNEFQRPMTGPTYARRLAEAARGADLHTGMTVLRLHPEGIVQATGPQGPETFQGKAVLLATGARETPRSARLVSGARPAGVMNTGTLQQAIYLHGQKPFRRPVVIGSELVAFSTLLTLGHVGVRPVALIEAGPRIVARRPADWVTRLAFGVPVLCNARLERILGREQVEGVEIDRGYGPERLDCDGVVFTGQFRPETALLLPSHLAVDAGTGGPAIDQFWRCSDPAYFAAGNLLRGIETAGCCYREGRAAADALLAGLANRLPPAARQIPVRAAGELSYVYPQRLSPGELSGAPADRGLMFKARVKAPVRGILRVLAGDREIWAKPISALPERRIAWRVPPQDLGGHDAITVRLERIT